MFSFTTHFIQPDPIRRPTPRPLARGPPLRPAGPRYARPSKRPSWTSGGCSRRRRSAACPTPAPSSTRAPPPPPWPPPSPSRRRPQRRPPWQRLQRRMPPSRLRPQLREARWGRAAGGRERQWQWRAEEVVAPGVVLAGPNGLGAHCYPQQPAAQAVAQVAAQRSDPCLSAAQAVAWQRRRTRPWRRARNGTKPRPSCCGAGSYPPAAAASRCTTRRGRKCDGHVHIFYGLALFELSIIYCSLKKLLPSLLVLFCLASLAHHDPLQLSGV